MPSWLLRCRGGARTGCAFLSLTKMERAPGWLRLCVRRMTARSDRFDFTVATPAPWPFSGASTRILLDEIAMMRATLTNAIVPSSPEARSFRFSQAKKTIPSLDIPVVLSRMIPLD